MTPVRGVLLDKDGTLTDFHATWAPVFLHLARRLGGHRERELLLLAGWEVDRGRGGADSVLVAGTVQELASVWAPAIGWDVADLTDHLDRSFAQHMLHGSRAVRDLAPTLESLHARGVTLGIATNDTRLGAASTLDALGVRHLFGFVVTAEDVAAPKPAPEMGLRFCEATGLKPHEVVMVGDSNHDLRMARAAGMGAVGVLTGTASHERLQGLADAVLEGLWELPTWLAPRLPH